MTYSKGVVLAAITFSFRIQAFDADTGATLWLAPTLGAPSSAPVVVGDTLYVGAGTRETDAEFKAFGNRIQQLLSGPLGEHPLSRLSGIFAYRLRPERRVVSSGPAAAPSECRESAVEPSCDE